MNEWVMFFFGVTVGVGVSVGAILWVSFRLYTKDLERKNSRK